MSTTPDGAKGSPILVWCEGSGILPSGHIGNTGRCLMCGRYVRLDPAGKTQAHQRDDIRARRKRGDFN